MKTKIIYNNKRFKNLMININFKSLIIAKISKHLFLLDNTETLNLAYYKTKVTKFIAKKETNPLQTIYHNNLKSLSINAYLTNNLKTKSYLTQSNLPIYNAFENNQILKTYLLKTIQGGYMVRTNTGIVGFISTKNFHLYIKALSNTPNKKYNKFDSGLVYSLCNFNSKIKNFSLEISNTENNNDYKLHLQIEFCPVLEH